MWLQRIIYQDLYNVGALLRANRAIESGEVSDDFCFAKSLFTSAVVHMPRREVPL